MVDITVDTRNGPLPAYLATPAGDGPWPGVIVVHDVGGVTADIRHHTDRLAAAGYLALAPKLFRGKIRCVVSTLRSLSSGSGPAVDDLVVARDHLAADPRCTGKVACVGFCMGGGFCLLLAPQGAFDAAAPNYGNLPKDTTALERSCPIVASYGAKDPTLRGVAPALEDVLTRGAVPHDVKEYPDVGHSFMNDWRDDGLHIRAFDYVPGFRYSQPEADDAWRRILAFFDAHLS